jgi:hypothetical protein
MFLIPVSYQTNIMQSTFSIREQSHPAPGFFQSLKDRIVNIDRLFAALSADYSQRRETWKGRVKPEEKLDRETSPEITQSKKLDRKIEPELRSLSWKRSVFLNLSPLLL